MKILLLKNNIPPKPLFPGNQVLETGDEYALRLIEQGKAIPAPPAQKPAKREKTAGDA